MSKRFKAVLQIKQSVRVILNPHSVSSSKDQKFFGHNINKDVVRGDPLFFRSPIYLHPIPMYYSCNQLAKFLTNFDNIISFIRAIYLVVSSKQVWQWSHSQKEASVAVLLSLPYMIY